MVEPWRLVSTVRSLISTYRGGGYCDISISEYRVEDDNYVVKGRYSLTKYGGGIERGDFEIKLDKQLNPLSINISEEGSSEG